MVKVDDEAALEAAFATAQTQAARAFGDASVYLETWLCEPRHIEFQIIGDGERTVGGLERECSVQRRHQKVIEEAPAPMLDRERLAQVEAAAVAALTGYDSLGTVETLYADGDFGFLEVNTRLQVEHGVTEEITGIDLVAAQNRIAAGERLGTILPARIEADGFAVEARIYAEDSTRMLPSTGKLAVYRPPSLTGVRVETGYAEGQAVTPYFDPLLAKVIGTGSTQRAEPSAGRWSASRHSRSAASIPIASFLRTPSVAKPSSRGAYTPACWHGSVRVTAGSDARISAPSFGRAEAGAGNSHRLVARLQCRHGRGVQIAVRNLPAAQRAGVGADANLVPSAPWWPPTSPLPCSCSVRSNRDCRWRWVSMWP